MNKYMIINHQYNFLHILVCVVLLHVIIKAYRIKCNCFFCQKSHFLKIVHLRVYHRTHLINKIKSYEIWNYSLGSILQFALFKIKIRLLQSNQKCLHRGSSTKPLLPLCKRDNTPKKNNTGHLDENKKM